MTIFGTPEEKTFENIVGKGENAGDQHFPFFHSVFSPMKDKLNVFSNF